MSAQEGIIHKLKTPNPKTCDTILQSDPSMESGMYWIDPDGQGQGDRPIYVYFNMAFTFVVRVLLLPRVLLRDVYFYV